MLAQKSSDRFAEWSERRRGILWLLVLGCVTVEDKVASFDGLVARKAGVVHRLAGGFAVVKLSVLPAAGRGVFVESLTMN
jgi:hypothetical protein